MTTAPFCPLPLHHRARAYTPAHATDLRATFARVRAEGFTTPMPAVWRWRRAG